VIDNALSLSFSQLLVAPARHPAAFRVDAMGPQGRQQLIVLHNGILSFNVSGYDPSQPVVIDPSISYSTYLGGSGTYYGYAVALSCRTRRNHCRSEP
jgi:hypothetical protein